MHAEVAVLALKPITDAEPEEPLQQVDLRAELGDGHADVVETDDVDHRGLLTGARARSAHLTGASRCAHPAAAPSRATG